MSNKPTPKNRCPWAGIEMSPVQPLTFLVKSTSRSRVVTPTFSAPFQFPASEGGATAWARTAGVTSAMRAKRVDNAWQRRLGEGNG
jgi:hypothetical protein